MNTKNHSLLMQQCFIYQAVESSGWSWGPRSGTESQASGDEYGGVGKVWTHHWGWPLLSTDQGSSGQYWSLCLTCHLEHVRECYFDYLTGSFTFKNWEWTSQENTCKVHLQYFINEISMFDIYILSPWSNRLKVAWKYIQ